MSLPRSDYDLGLRPTKRRPVGRGHGLEHPEEGEEGADEEK